MIEASVTIHSNNVNDYGRIAKIYNRSHEKPDKKYSILPTIIKFMNSARNPKVILDLGCGDGFFTFPLAETFPEALVLGFDNSILQISLANKNKNNNKINNVEFGLRDVFLEELPNANLIVAPFILNYLPTQKKLLQILKKIRMSLVTSGKVLFVFDNPRGFDNSRFGAKKEIVRRKIKLTLFKSKDEKICNLESYFYTPKTILDLLSRTGFSNIKIHEPIISTEGFKNRGKDFWNGFIEQSELLYISADK